MSKFLCFLTFFLGLNGAMASPVADYLRSAQGQAEMKDMAAQEESINEVEILHLGPKAFETRLRLIKEAQNVLFISLPFWIADFKGLLLKDILASTRAKKPDLDMRLMIDSFTPFVSRDAFGDKIFDDLEDIFKPHYMLWNSPLWQRRFSFDIFNHQIHEKFFIADSRKAIIGGMNHSSTYLEGGETRVGWHDTDLLLEGPAARELTKIYLKLWLIGGLMNSADHFPPWKKQETEAFQGFFFRDQDTYTFKMMDSYMNARGVPHQTTHTVHFGLTPFLNNPKYLPDVRPQGTIPVRLIYDNPLFDRDPKTGRQFSRTRNIFGKLTSHTQHSIDIFGPYLTLSKEFENILIGATARGVRVRIITNSVESHDMGKAMYYSSLNHYKKLIEAGVEIYEWQGHKPLVRLEVKNNCTIPIGLWPGDTMHSKAAIFDGDVLMLGSHNFNKRSEQLNSEVMALINDEGKAREMSQIFEQDLDIPWDRKIQCSDQLIQRPRLVRQITAVEFAELWKKYGAKARFWKVFEKLY